MFASLHVAAHTCRRIETGNPVSRMFDNAELGMAVWRQRQQLARLDKAALSDIGLSRAEALSEAARPLWDVPSHWRR